MSFLEAWESVSMVGSLIHSRRNRLVYDSESFQRIHNKNSPNNVVTFTQHPFSTAWILAESLSLEETTGIVIFFHGTGSYKANSLPWGYQVSKTCKTLFICVEYPGYEFDTDNKKPSIIQSQKWATKFIHWLRSSLQEFGEKEKIKRRKETILNQIQILQNKIYLMGHCVGVSTVLHVANVKNSLSIAGIILIS